MTAAFRTMCLAGALLVLSSCTSGPRTIPADRYDYNAALARSWNEQLLLNLVRLRYRDTPLFLEIDSIVAQYRWSGRGAAGATLGAGSNDVDLGLSGEYVESPTITYVPLQGEDFANRLLAPIPPTTLLLLAQSGWGVDRLFLTCVQQVNDVRNRPASLEDEPAWQADDGRFSLLAQLLRQHQQAGLLDVRIEQTEGGDSTWLHLRPPDEALERDRADQIAALMGIAPGAERYRLLPSAITELETDIAILPRSVLAVMAYLAQGVQLPGEAQAPLQLMTVRAASEEPEQAYVRVRYRGQWWFIGADDRESKSTFGLLTQLFSLQAAGGRTASPLLTISASP